MNIPALLSFRLSVQNSVALTKLYWADNANALYALNALTCVELKQAFSRFDRESELRVGIFSAKGGIFSTGIELSFLDSVNQNLGSIHEVN